MLKRSQIDLTHIGSHDSMAASNPQPVETVLADLKKRSDAYENLQVERVGDLNIRYIETDGDHSQSGYYARIGQQDMLFSPQAMRTASKLVGIRDYRHWKKYPDRNAFPTTLSHILENPAMSGNRKNPKHLLVRHDGLQIRAVLPQTYQIKDSYDLLADFVQIVTESGAEIRGISCIESGRHGVDGDVGDFSSYRVIVGDNIMPLVKPEFGQYMMFLLACSETGANVSPGATAATALGLYRTSCTNSAIRDALITKWNHRSKGLSDFVRGTTYRIRQTPHYQNQYTAVFGELVQAKLTDLTPRDLLHGIAEQKLITSGHADAAELYIDQLTEDGRHVETQYDVYNVLTRSAQDLPTLIQRQQGETRALHLFTEKGGVFERIRDAAQENGKNIAMRRGGDNPQF